MTEMTINVNVSGCAKLEIGVTPQLEQLLTRLLAPNVVASLDSIRIRDYMETRPLEVERLSGEEQPQTDEPTQEPQNAEVTTQEPPVAEEEPTQEPIEEEQPVVVDKEYVRAAMDSVRKRIEGPEWETDTTTESYKRYHKQLTSIFKNLALQLGGCKPTELPTEELRLKFEDEIRQIAVDENGELITPKAPF